MTPASNTPSVPVCLTCDDLGFQAGAHTERINPCPTCEGIQRYRTIVADPPWHYDGFANNVGSRQTVALPYPSMSLDELAELPVAELAHQDCRLWLWTTNRYLRPAFDLIDTWGFSYSRTLVWAKPDPPPVSNGHIAWFGVEFLLVAQRGRPAIGGVMPSYFVHPNMRHSQKPEAFLDYIEQVSPGPYVELFARRNRFGWDTWGNESLEHVGMVA